MGGAGDGCGVWHGDPDPALVDGFLVSREMNRGSCF